MLNNTLTRIKTWIAGLVLSAVVIVGHTAHADITLPPPAERDVIEVNIHGYDQLAHLFDDLNYTLEQWNAGERVVPRLFLQTIPTVWRDELADQLTVEAKKRTFFRTLGPLTLLANEEIALQQRALREAIDNNDSDIIAELAKQYRVETAPDDPATIAELEKRIAPVPASLAMAQMAIESGWGTSRFAALGNALFGQWTYGDEGITPKEQRSHLGDYKIAAFDTPFGSVRAYMKNLNTGSAYQEFRDKRAKMIANEEPLSGTALAETLTRYSERGEEYIKDVKAVIRQNNLGHADDAVLDDGPYYYLIPKGD
ncbi:glucosaminidase domain-containing protein [Thalassospira sp.]|uniref:glucosaminidase domain-containing protein n=1 Tax=Thalassospira sp. TaxID=1912094 RepID=UPI001B03A3C7|nr:glucosaminidase domain-containing protein [Thalassospira sp.]MBO6808396.1 glucosaminidase domain-containing protein [Thalassospira sp.]MBO6839906.1 glucosaminidase domain-containing protein [Thalassospira sp.]